MQRYNRLEGTGGRRAAAAAEVLARRQGNALLGLEKLVHVLSDLGLVLGRGALLGGRLFSKDGEHVCTRVRAAPSAGRARESCRNALRAAPPAPPQPKPRGCHATPRFARAHAVGADPCPFTPVTLFTHAATQRPGESSCVVKSAGTRTGAPVLLRPRATRCTRSRARASSSVHAVPVCEGRAREHHATACTPLPDLSSKCENNLLKKQK